MSKAGASRWMRLRERAARFSASHWALALLWCVFIAVAASSLGGYRHIARSDLDKELASAEMANAHLARVLEEHTLAVLQRVDQITQFLVYRHREYGWKMPFNSYIEHGEISLENLNQVGIINTSGYLQFSSVAQARPVDLSDREHFLVHAGFDSPQLHISKPLLGRASGKWSVQLSRRINNPDGTFAGVVVVSLDPDYFTRLYAEVNSGTRDVIVLVGADGIVRARRSGSGNEIGQDLGGTQLMQRAAAAASGVYHATSRIDQAERIYAFRRVPGYPLVVAVGSERSVVLGAYSVRIATYRAVLSAALLLLLLFTLGGSLLLVRLRRNFAELEAGKLKAEEGSAAKTAFLASVTHEMRVPLAAILGGARMLQERGQLDDEQRRAVDVVMQNGEKLRTLVDDVLDMASIQADRLEPSLGPVDVEPLARSCVSAVSSQAVARNVAVEFRCEPGIPRIETDARWVRHILRFLLDNAIKFSVHGSRIGLEVSVAAHDVRIAVWDSGLGISRTELLKLFSPVVTLDAGLARDYEGSGLGLALSQGLARRLGGSISLDTTPGRGSRFTVSLPLRRSPEAEVRPVAATDPGDGFGAT